MKRLFIALTISGMAALPGWSVAATDGDIERGRDAAAVCVACHQADGNGMHSPAGESWPRLAGLDAGYIARQLQEYKSGQRQSPSMTPFANMLTDQQVNDVAAYFSQLTPGAAGGGDTADAATLALGKRLALQGDWSRYLVSCKSCHGPDNQGAGSVFPGIAGQHAGYIEAQLKAWQAGTRKNDAQDLMGTIARRMSDADIQAVAAWLSTQPAQSN